MDIDSIETERNIKTLIWPVDSFGRSVNLKLDLGNTADITKFHFTEKSVRLLDELLDACDDGNRDRAFSVIGPYGSGKSLFGLLVSTVFAKESSTWSEKTLAQLEDENPELSRKLDSVLSATELGFFPIIVQGEKGPFDLALCNALFEALTSEDRVTDWVPRKLTQSIHLTMETIKSGLNRSSDVVELYKQASDHARASGYRGLIVVADEFGKFLERGATQGELPDLVASQYLAELARDNRDSKILFMVLVHQSFQDYASTLSQDQRLEWSKVQGRFRQVDFSDQSEDLYDLIASCLSRNILDQSSDKEIKAWADRIVEQVKEIPLFQGDVKHQFWKDFLPSVYPFHPIALYGLPRLSARLGQNERTLFTFLISEDPLGLKRFLSETFIDEAGLPSLTFDVVVDFFLYSARFSSWSPDIRQSISELEYALERLGDRPELETRLIKAIGGIKLLRAGPVLPNTKSTLIATLGLGNEDGDALVTSALDALVSRKIVVHRKFSDEYHLWEGSDFDFDQSIATTREEIKNGIDISLTLPSKFLSRQLIAHKHGLMTGNTRSFARVFKSVEECRNLNVEELLVSKTGRVTAGLIIHCAPSTMTEVDYLKEWASGIEDERLLITIPEAPSDALSFVIDLAALKRIRDENPAIGEDPVAFKELSSREQGLADLLEDELIELTEPGPSGPRWYWKGKANQINDSKTMNQLLSSICDDLYPEAPHIHNELINRYQISGAVVTAVKKIATELLRGTQEERLGLEGNGPEVSIFKTVYEKTGIYRRKRDGWSLYGPGEQDGSNIGPVWNAITEYIQSCNRTSKSLNDLFLKLQDRPYGMRAAMVRLLVWTVLVRNRDSICLYYDGTFIPAWDVESFELSSRVPEKFTVRYLISESSTKTVVAGLARTLNVSRRTVGVNTVLHAIFSWYRNLPEYAKQTTHISEEAKGLRDAITTSSDPIDLLFSRIPMSLGLPPLIDAGTGTIAAKLPKVQTETLIDKFDEAFHEIESSYSKLHDGMVQVLSEGLGCENTVPALQDWIKTRNVSLDGYIRDIQTKAFMNRAVDGSGRETSSWLESLGATLTNQSPRQWLDWTLDEFREKVALVSQTIEDADRRKFALGDTALAERAVRLVVESTDDLLLDRIIDSEEESPDVLLMVNWIRAMVGDRGTEYDKDRIQRLLAQALVYTLAEDSRSGDSDA